MLHTVDEGKTWVRQESQTRKWIYDIDSPDGKRIWAVGLDGIVLTSVVMSVSFKRR